MEDPVQNNGALASERKLGNITITIRLPKPDYSADTRELNITLPEQSMNPYPIPGVCATRLTFTLQSLA